MSHWLAAQGLTLGGLLAAAGGLSALILLGLNPVAWVEALRTFEWTAGRAGADRQRQRFEPRRLAYVSSSSEKKARREAARRRVLRGRRAAMTQAEQERARIQRDIDRQLSSWTWRRITSWTLFGLALLIAIQHVVAHSGWRPLPISMGWQDLLVGYPTAGVLAIAGAILLDARSARP